MVRETNFAEGGSDLGGILDRCRVRSRWRARAGVRLQALRTRALLCICLACHRAKGLFQYDSDEEDDLMGGGKRGKKGRKARKYDDDDEQELSASPPKKVLELQADVLEG